MPESEAYRAAVDYERNVREGIMTSGPFQATAPSDIGAATMRRVSMRLVPFLMICYIIAYIDRVNAGFAALQMNQGHDREWPGDWQ